MKPTKQYEAVDWHGEFLNIIQDKNGTVIIRHYPYETVFNAEEMIEIKQFVTEYV